MMGGLGNFLFPLATAMSLAAEHNLEVRLFYAHFGALHTHPIRYMMNIFYGFNEQSDISGFTKLSECRFEYNPIHLPAKTNVFLDGYFQSEKYFVKHRGLVLQRLAPPIGEDERLAALWFTDDQPTVSLHVRRKNYLQLRHVYPELFPDYYQKALEMFPDHKVLVFSDDIAFCKEAFVGDRFLFVDSWFDLHDLWIMSMCDHNIIANSSFSWWGAWLNQNPDKKVIAPKQWFTDSTNLNYSDVVCEGWTKI
jgi:hypothetical protein